MTEDMNGKVVHIAGAGSMSLDSPPRPASGEREQKKLALFNPLVKNET